MLVHLRDGSETERQKDRQTEVGSRWEEECGREGGGGGGGEGGRTEWF